MRRRLPIGVLFTCLCCACEGAAPTETANSVEAKLARALAAACPLSAPNDAQARRECADKLLSLQELRDVATDPMLWGGQSPDTSLENALEDSNLTEFNPRVWRRMYLSTFMFTGNYEIEVAGAYRVLKMQIFFRNMLDPGDYPYPFWHSKPKWESYEQAVDLLFFFRGERVVGVTRSKEKDGTRSHVEHVWDGNWMWSDGAEPKVALFKYMFSPMNPHVEKLEAAYRDLSDGLREQNCISCHSPDNSQKVRNLELLNFPNMTLTGRHKVVQMLETNLMPPGTGVTDAQVRSNLLRFAQEFAKAGDNALAFEGETVVPN